MAQKRYNNWQDYRLSDINNRKDLAAMPQGRWRGFDFELAGGSGGVSLVLTHAVTGYDETDEAGAAHPTLGMVKTKQGVIVVEDAPVTIALTDNNAGTGTRIDLVVLQHTYVATTGGVSAGYSVLLGTVGSGVPPAIPFPDTTIVLGTITWPAHGTDILAATYVQELAPVAGGGEAGGQDYVLKSKEQIIVAKKQIYHQTGRLVALTYVSRSLVNNTTNSNYYSVAFISSDYLPVDYLTVPFDGELTHIEVYTEQRLILTNGGNFQLQSGTTCAIEAKETFEVFKIGSKLAVVRGNEVHRDRATKMFASIIGNKGTVARDTSTAISLDNKGNYAELTISFGSMGNINLISGNAGLWNGSDAITKGGNVVFLKIKNTDLVGGARLTFELGGTPSGAYKPLTFPLDVGSSISSITVYDEGCLVLLENENDWMVLASFDAATFTESMRLALTTGLSTLSGYITTLQNLTDPGSWAAIPYNTGWSASSPAAAYLLDGGGRVHLRGRFTPAGGAPTLIANLPAGCFPTSTMFLPILKIVGGVMGLGVVVIDSTGQVLAPLGSIGAGDTWILDGVTFLNY